MRIYTTGSSGLWPLFIGIGVVLLVIIGLGGLLLTTPLGLAILAFWGLSSIYRNWQRRKYQNQFESGQRTWQSNGEETYSQSSWQEKQEANTSEDPFAAYRQEDSSRGVFTVDDLRNAQDVEYKEL